MSNLNININLDKVGDISAALHHANVLVLLFEARAKVDGEAKQGLRIAYKLQAVLHHRMHLALINY